MDEDRRRQIEEEERYRAEVRAKLERENDGSAASRAFGGSPSDSAPLNSEPLPPAKPTKRRGGCLRTVGVIVGIFFLLVVISNIVNPDPPEGTRQNPAPQQRTPVAAPIEEPEATPTPEPETPEPEPEPAPPAPEPQAQNVVVLPDGSTIDEIEAIVLCESLVRDQLVSPRSARFPGAFRGNYEEPVKVANNWVYNVVVDAENSFGAELRSNFLCTLSGDDNTSSVSQVE